MKLCFSVLVFATIVNCDPRIIELRNYIAGDSIVFDNVETGAKLYLASNDDNDILENIQVTTGTTSLSLDQLNKNNAGGSPISVTITNGLTLKTANSDPVTHELTGFLYLTNKEQADDREFSVIVIKDKHIITTPGGQNFTVVVLNTALVSDSIDADKPEKTSYVTAMNQFPDTDLHFHWGIPAWNWTKVTINQFFENPLRWDNYGDDFKYINTTTTFFDKVDPLPVNVDYWYLTTTGPVTMSVENKYVSNHEYTTRSVNSTGLISNSFLFMEHRVHFLLDYTRTRTVGTLISLWPDSEDYINFYLGNADSDIQQHYNSITNVKHGLIITELQASYLIINSTASIPGTFFCQYYGFTGDLLPVTTTTTGPSTSTITVPSTTTVMTTTKSSWSPRALQMIFLVFLLVLTIQ